MLLKPTDVPRFLLKTKSKSKRSILYPTETWNRTDKKGNFNHMSFKRWIQTK